MNVVSQIAAELSTCVANEVRGPRKPWANRQTIRRNKAEHPNPRRQSMHPAPALRL